LGPTEPEVYKPLKSVMQLKSMQCQTYYGYLPNHTMSVPCNQYQFIGLPFGDRSTCVNNLPEVITWQQELIPQPLNRKSNTPTITPPSRTGSI